MDALVGMWLPPGNDLSPIVGLGENIAPLSEPRAISGGSFVYKKQLDEKSQDCVKAPTQRRVQECTSSKIERFG
jgi:hypothetical protein